MNKLTPYALFALHPIELRETFNLPMYPALKLVKQAADSKGKKPLTLLLRSLANLDNLIHQRYYYLQHYTKSSEEKILCLQNNISELVDISKDQEEDPNCEDNSEDDRKYISFLFDLHMLQLGELYWTIPKKRMEAEKLWLVYHKNKSIIDMLDVLPILLFRYPLFSNPSAFESNALLSMEDDIALHTYAKALYYFTQESASEKANTYLKQSLELNSQVPSLLLQKKKIPKKPPTEFTPGEQSEARYIAYLAAETWWNTEGAIHWLRETANQAE